MKFHQHLNFFHVVKVVRSHLIYNISDMHMDVWKSESSPWKQAMLSAGVFVVGLILIFLTRNFDEMADVANGRAGFYLGILLAASGLIGAMVGCKKQVTTVDPVTRAITVESTGIFGKKMKQIRFDEIEDISIGRLGKSSNFVVSYHLVLKLRGGGTYPLFPAGYFYEGAYDRTAVEEKRERLRKYCEMSPGENIKMS